MSTSGTAYLPSLRAGDTWAGFRFRPMQGGEPIDLSSVVGMISELRAKSLGGPVLLELRSPDDLSIEDGRVVFASRDIPDLEPGIEYHFNLRLFFADGTRTTHGTFVQPVIESGIEATEFEL